MLTDLRQSSLGCTTRSIECDVVLRDGSTLHLRPADTSDEVAISTFYDELSSDSFYRRFLSVRSPFRRPPIPHDTLSRFVLLGEVRNRVVAVAEYARMKADPARAEVAFAVADELQSRGVAARMLEILAETARAEGIAAFVSLVLGTNRTMMDVFRDSGFGIEQRLDAGVYEVTLSLEPSAEYDSRLAAREQTAAATSMKQFFEPRTVAVIGASRSAEHIGGQIFRNLRAADFRGRVYPVNPNATEVDSVRCYPKVTDIAGPIDLAIVTVPAEHVPSVVDDCSTKRVPAVVVISANFAEIGPMGQARERALLAKIRSNGMRMIGPNCMGVLNTDPAVSLNATFAKALPPRGSVAFASQSGAFGLSILEHAKRLRLGISTFVSVGNKADVSGNDLIQYWANDQKTDVILLYLESFGNPRTFGRLARRTAREKPIVAIKAGRSRAGARAASSHTGAMASSDAVADGLFQQAGIIRTSSVSELFDVASLLSRQPLPKGKRVAIVTNAGGPGILAADACEAGGLELPSLSSSTTAALRAILPAAASVQNPVDMLAAAPADHYAAVIRAVLADENVESLVVIYIPPFVTEPAAVASAIANAAAGAKKPVVTVFMTASEPPAALDDVPTYAFPEPAVAALAHVAKYAEWRARPVSSTRAFADVDRMRVRKAIEDGLLRGGGWLDPFEVQEVMVAVGIPEARLLFADTPDRAVEAARSIGYPVAVKAAGAKIVHKSEVGGVRLSLLNEGDVRDTYGDFSRRLGDDLAGVVVQEMVPGSIEVMVGAVQDPMFGPVIAYGSGGVLLELMSDVAFRLQPLTETDVVDMMNDVKGTALLRGYRGSHADEEAVREVLLRVSTLIELCPEIQELDLNPIKVCPSGVKVVDARIRVERLHPRVPSTRIRY